MWLDADYTPEQPTRRLLRPDFAAAVGPRWLRASAVHVARRVFDRAPQRTRLSFRLLRTRWQGHLFAQAPRLGPRIVHITFSRGMRRRPRHHPPYRRWRVVADEPSLPKP